MSYPVAIFLFQLAGWVAGIGLCISVFRDIDKAQRDINNLFAEMKADRAKQGREWKRQENTNEDLKLEIDGNSKCITLQGKLLNGLLESIISLQRAITPTKPKADAHKNMASRRGKVVERAKK